MNTNIYDLTFIISIWLIIGVLCEQEQNVVSVIEEPAEISQDVFDSIIEHLKSVRVMEKDDIVTSFVQYHEILIGRGQNYDIETAEICQWGSLFKEMDSPTNNICNIVAVQLSQITLSKFLSESDQPTSGFVAYECYEKEVDNAEKTRYGKIRKPVIYCPSTIVTRSDGSRVNLDGFLIGDAYEKINSVNVYEYTINEESTNGINLVYYMENIFRNDIMYLTADDSKDYFDQMKKMETDLGLNEFCEAPITTKMRVCKYAAMNKFVNEENKRLHRTLINREKQFHADTSGLVPYRCLKRPLTVITMVGFHVLMIYCSDQIFKIGNVFYKQSGFFYAVSKNEGIHLYNATFRKNENDSISLLKSIHLSISLTKESRMTDTFAHFEQEFTNTLTSLDLPKSKL